MSVLNQSGEEQVECPLCMEALEVDDLNFFPCTCGYQICRFCWHRIRLDENGGLCPACRKAYSENPADFIPLSREQVAKLKAEKRQRDQQRKAKLTESRKHLASVRVVQRNLVFVVGLPPRLADPEILKRHEYFGKFGKIHKVVINQSTSYAGSQGPSASAYVTYLKSDDALRAIQAVNNVTIDNRIIKSSLGTTKYCSHFMKNQPCPKPDCMYLHEYGDSEASFTKDQMHAGKHQEYEKKLHDDLLARTKAQNGQAGEMKPATVKGTKEVTSTTATATTAGVNNNNNYNNGVISIPKEISNGSTNKESWPQLDKDKKQEKDKSRRAKTKNGEVKTKEKKESKGGSSSNSSSSSESRSSQDSRTTSTSSNGSQNIINSKIEVKDSDIYASSGLSSEPSPSSSPPSSHTQTPPPPQRCVTPVTSAATPTGSCAFAAYGSKLPTSLMGTPSEDNNSYFSSSGFTKLQNQVVDSHVRKEEQTESDRLIIGSSALNKCLGEILSDDQGHQVLADTLPNIDTTQNWAAAFGFSTEQQHQQQQQQQQQSRETADILFQHKLHLPREVSKLQSFGAYGSTGPFENSFGKGLDNFAGSYDMSKLQENVMETLANKTNGINIRSQEPSVPQSPHLSNGLDHNLSKFFSDFNKYNTKEPPSPMPYQNGYNNMHYSSLPYLLQQKQIEEHILNLGMPKNNFGAAQTTVYQNGLSTPAFANGDSPLLNGNGSSIYSHFSKPQVAVPQSQMSRNSEAELDFDPFQETQKGLAEMLASEQSHKPLHDSAGRTGPMNGLVHNSNGSHIPPPPPGFMQQQQTHMNSVGSKILPFLTMSNSQQQVINPSNSWSNSFNPQLQHKNITGSNTCNDWKVLDPAILSSSRSYQVPQITAVRDPYGAAIPPPQQQAPQQPQPIAPQRSPFDFPPNNNSPFSAFAQQLQQPTYNSFAAHLNGGAAPQNVNWFATAATDLNAAQISSPPGFRTGQTTTKQQQEC